MHEEETLALCIGGPWDGRYMRIPERVREVVVPPQHANPKPVAETSPMTADIPTCYSYRYTGRKRWHTPKEAVYLFAWTGPKTTPMDDITAAAQRLLALMGHGGTLWDDRPDDAQPLPIDVFDRHAHADAQLEARRRAREGWA